MAALVEAKGLAQISDPAALEAIVDAVLAASPDQLKKYRGGKTKLQGYFVGRAPARARQRGSLLRGGCAERACAQARPGAERMTGAWAWPDAALAQGHALTLLDLCEPVVVVSMNDALHGG